MPNYRRVFISGGSYFFTVNLLERRASLLTTHARELQTAIRWTKRRQPFRIDALVILPDHLHAVLTLPEGDANFPLRWRLIKGRFSRFLERTEWRSGVRVRRRERGIWQRRFWEHLIRDDQDFYNHVAYCYSNPVKHGLVSEAKDWPHSTYRRDLRAGIFEFDLAMPNTSTAWMQRPVCEYSWVRLGACGASRA